MIAEDGDGKNHLVGSSDSGEVFFFARNELPDDNEFTGPTFSNDKKTLFACIQTPGHDSLSRARSTSNAEPRRSHLTGRRRGHENCPGREERTADGVEHRGPVLRELLV